MSVTQEGNDYPELVFGLVGPIGVNLDEVSDQLTTQLESVGYETELIRITDLIEFVRSGIQISNSSLYDKYDSLISPCG